MTFGFNSVARLCSGLWGYLTVKAQGRAAVELERERNLGTVEAIKALPPGAELLENEPNGRLRVIRMPGASQRSPTVMMSQVQLPVIEPHHPTGLDPANGEPNE